MKYVVFRLCKVSKCILMSITYTTFISIFNSKIKTRVLKSTQYYYTIIQATRGHGWPSASHDHGSAEGRPWVAV